MPKKKRNQKVDNKSNSNITNDEATNNETANQSEATKIILSDNYQKTVKEYIEAQRVQILEVEEILASDAPVEIIFQKLTKSAITHTLPISSISKVLEWMIKHSLHSNQDQDYYFDRIREITNLYNLYSETIFLAIQYNNFNLLYNLKQFDPSLFSPERPLIPEIFKVFSQYLKNVKLKNLNLNNLSTQFILDSNSFLVTSIMYFMLEKEQKITKMNLKTIMVNEFKNQKKYLGLLGKEFCKINLDELGAIVHDILDAIYTQNLELNVANELFHLTMKNPFMRVLLKTLVKDEKSIDYLLLCYQGQFLVHYIGFSKPMNDYILDILERAEKIFNENKNQLSSLIVDFYNSLILDPFILIKNSVKNKNFYLTICLVANLDILLLSHKDSHGKSNLINNIKLVLSELYESKHENEKELTLIEFMSRMIYVFRNKAWKKELARHKKIQNKPGLFGDIENDYHYQNDNNWAVKDVNLNLLLKFVFFGFASARNLEGVFEVIRQANLHLDEGNFNYFIQIMIYCGIAKKGIEFSLLLSDIKYINIKTGLELTPSLNSYLSAFFNWDSYFSQINLLFHRLFFGILLRLNFEKIKDPSPGNQVKVATFYLTIIRSQQLVLDRLVRNQKLIHYFDELFLSPALKNLINSGFRNRATLVSEYLSMVGKKFPGLLRENIFRMHGFKDSLLEIYFNQNLNLIEIFATNLFVIRAIITMTQNPKFELPLTDNNTNALTTIDANEVSPRRLTNEIAILILAFYFDASYTEMRNLYHNLLQYFYEVREVVRKNFPNKFEYKEEPIQTSRVEILEGSSNKSSTEFLLSSLNESPASSLPGKEEKTEEDERKEEEEKRREEEERNYFADPEEFSPTLFTIYPSRKRTLDKITSNSMEDDVEDDVIENPLKLSKNNDKS